MSSLSDDRKNYHIFADETRRARCDGRVISFRCVSFVSSLAQALSSLRVQALCDHAPRI